MRGGVNVKRKDKKMIKIEDVYNAVPDQEFSFYIKNFLNTYKKYKENPDDKFIEILLYRHYIITRFYWYKQKFAKEVVKLFQK